MRCRRWFRTVKPIIHNVVMSNAVHIYVSQSDKGELVIGAGVDGYNSYSQRGSFQIIEGQMGALLELFPIFSRLRMLRQWGGIVDVCRTPAPSSRGADFGLYLNAAGAPAVQGDARVGLAFAHTIAQDRAVERGLHPERFLRAR